MHERWIVRDWIRGGRCLVPVLVYPPGRPHEAMALSALIDTGANQSAIDSRIARILRLPTAPYQREVSSATAHRMATVYRAAMDIVTPPGVPVASHILDLTEILHPMVGGSVLIGMDVIEWARRFQIENSVWDLGPGTEEMKR